MVSGGGIKKTECFHRKETASLFHILKRQGPHTSVSCRRQEDKIIYRESLEIIALVRTWTLFLSILSSSLPIFLSSSLPLVLSSPLPFFHSSFLPLVLSSPLPLFPSSSLPLFLSSSLPVFLSSYLPPVLSSYLHLFLSNLASGYLTQCRLR